MDTTETAPSPDHTPRPLTEIVDEIAAQLGETEPTPRKTIKRAVRILGPERVQALLDRTLETERTGGLMLPDGSRRRTPGGVFFYLLRKSVAPKEGHKILRPHPPAAPAPPPDGTQETTPAPKANG